MNIRTSILWASLLVCPVLVACGDDSGGGTGGSGSTSTTTTTTTGTGTGGATGSGGGGTGADADHGKEVVTANGCFGCHGADLAGNTTAITGMAYASNLTPDMATGIGAWDEKQITDAIVSGTDDEGATLCAIMPKFATLSETDVADVVAYLKSVPAVNKEIPESTCP